MAAIIRVYTLALAAEMLGETEDALHEAAMALDPEDGMITVYGPDEATTPAFTDHGLDSLQDQLRELRANGTIS